MSFKAEDMHNDKDFKEMKWGGVDSSAQIVTMLGGQSRQSQLAELDDQLNTNGNQTDKTDPTVEPKASTDVEQVKH